jgi:hypothetical protein
MPDNYESVHIWPHKSHSPWKYVFASFHFGSGPSKDTFYVAISSQGQPQKDAVSKKLATR